MRILTCMLLAGMLLPNTITAQSEVDSTKHRVTLTGSVSTYYASRSTNTIFAGEFQEFDRFLSSGARDENFGLDVARFIASYSGSRIRGTFGLQAGDLPLSSWSAEYPNIQEANVGFRIAEKWWVDAGFFTTHIGYESIYPSQKFLSSTAYVSYNEPFFQSGLRVSYDPGPKWSLQAWVLNGYNSFVDNNRAKSVGVSVNYRPNERITLSYNNLLGDEAIPDRLAEFPTKYRMAHNLYWYHEWSEVFTTVLNLTGVTQTNSVNAREGGTAVAGGGFLTLHSQVAERWAVTGRLESYTEPDAFLGGRIATPGFNGNKGLRVDAITLGTEYRPVPSTYARLELRYADQGDDIVLFEKDEERVNSRLELLITAGIAIDWTRRW